jgi:hypothetical protein
VSTPGRDSAPRLRSQGTKDAGVRRAGPRLATLVDWRAGLPTMIVHHRSTPGFPGVPASPRPRLPGAIPGRPHAPPADGRTDHGSTSPEDLDPHPAPSVGGRCGLRSHTKADPTSLDEHGFALLGRVEEVREPLAGLSSCVPFHVYNVRFPDRGRQVAWMCVLALPACVLVKRSTAGECRRGIG